MNNSSKHNVPDPMCIKIMGKKLYTLTLVLVTLTAKAQSCPDDNHPHMIDLGLPSGTKWACCNVGATKPEEYGDYYTWGETEEKSVYNWSTCKYWTDNNGDGFPDDHEFTYLGIDIAGTGYDVAHVKWGGSWVMPSHDQQVDLLDNCTYTWTSINGVKGGLFTGPNGSTIFLPVAGYRWEDELRFAGSYGYYWSSTQSPYESSYAYFMSFHSDEAYWAYRRGFGQSVRPVISVTNSIHLPESSSDKSSQPVYNVFGIKVADNLRYANTLPSGVYIVNGKKFVVKF